MLLRCAALLLLLGACDPTAGAPRTRRAFVTSRFYRGDLRTSAGAASGLEGGDLLCRQVAEDAGLVGSWRAWLSTSTMNAIDRITGDGPFLNMRGQVAFADRAQLAADPSASMAVNELGGNLSETFAWTGTRRGGASSGKTCGDWADQGAEGSGGSLTGTGVGAGWTDSAGSLPCREPHPIYCFEQ